MIDKRIVKIMLKDGFTPRQIAKECGLPRAEVEKIAQEIKGERQAARRRLLKIVALSLVVVLPVSYLLYEKFREPSGKEIAENFARCVEAIPITQSGYSWFITQDVPADKTLLLKDIELLEKLTRKLDDSLARNSGLKEVAELQRMFGGHMMPSLFSASGGGTSRMATRGKAEEILARMRDPRTQEVVFYESFGFRHPKIQERFVFYDSDWRALIIAAINFTDEKWFDALFIHELWHAKAHRKGSPGATAHVLSDPWIDEEIEAHLIEKYVLDAGTKGQYNELIEKLASQVHARSLRQFFVNVKPGFFRELDKLFKPCLREEQGLRAAQYTLNLAQAWVKQNKPENFQSLSREAYKLITDPENPEHIH